MDDFAIDELHARFEKFNDEYNKFDRVESKLHERPDMHVFLFLAALCHGTCDMVACASHDEIWLDVSPHHLATISDDDLRDLIRCGLRIDTANDSLCMFA